MPVEGTIALSGGIDKPTRLNFRIVGKLETIQKRASRTSMSISKKATSGKPR
jgi:hypothetical protein